MQKRTLHMDLYIICGTNHKTEPKGICYMIGPNETATVELVKSCFQKERGKLLEEEGNDGHHRVGARHTHTRNETRVAALAQRALYAQHGHRTDGNR